MTLFDTSVDFFGAAGDTARGRPSDPGKVPPLPHSGSTVSSMRPLPPPLTRWRLPTRCGRWIERPCRGSLSNSLLLKTLLKTLPYPTRQSTGIKKNNAIQHGLPAPHRPGTKRQKPLLVIAVLNRTNTRDCSAVPPRPFPLHGGEDTMPCSSTLRRTLAKFPQG